MKAARAVSKTRALFITQLFIPCWNTDSTRVLQMMRSAHCTMTIDVKYLWWKRVEESRR
jgi:hypothetical protein